MSDVIKAVATPNPDAYMFRVQETLIPTGTFEFFKEDDVSNSPLAQKILGLEHIELILIAPRFITVRKDSEIEWAELLNLVLETLENFLSSGEMAVIESDPKDKSSANHSELELQIIELLNEDVRPAIAQDGGDLIFHGLEDGIVKLELIGACGTCPSSTATLHFGIQNLLMEEFDEVKGVEQVVK